MLGFFKKKSDKSAAKKKITHLSPKDSVPARNHSRKGGSLLMKMVNWFLWLVFLGIVTYILFFSPLMMVGDISIEGGKTLQAEDLRNFARSQISGKHWNFLQKNNFLLISGKRLEEALGNRFKRIENVSVSKEFPNRLNVRIDERKSTLVFCAENSCWVINEKGEAFAGANFSSNELGERELLVLRNDNQKDVSQKDILMDVETINFITEALRMIQNDLGIALEKEIYTPALISGDIRMRTGEGWMIYLNKNLGTERSIEMLKAILEKSLDQEKKMNLEYIDLRVANKAYYKLKKIEDGSGDNTGTEPEKNI